MTDTSHPSGASPRASNDGGADPIGTVAPPTTFVDTMRRIGPGLIIAASIVGSGELIATTKTGAVAGIWLLWLIIVGCLIKVFVQVELGRYAITHGQTTLAALNTLPGRIAGVNWMIWYWLVMMACSIAQLGGIVGGVGQSMALAMPITGDYVAAIQVPSEKELKQFLLIEDDMAGDEAILSALDQETRDRVIRGHEDLHQRIEAAGERGTAALDSVRQTGTFHDPRTFDDRYWSAAVGVVTSILLFVGRYGLIQAVSTALVVMFTFVTIGNVISLQTTQEWSLTATELWQGLQFRLPPEMPKSIVPVSPLMIALATFGIIGVGASELVAYPYWCLEKGYARFTGPRTSDENWADRARGWLRVMRIDAFISMVIYTIATVAFYLLGAIVLHRRGMDPDGMRMVSTLAEVYVPVFGEYAKWLFLVGAIAVLYSTFLVALAGHARMYTDALKVWKLIPADNEVWHRRWVSGLGLFLPILCVGIYWAGANPTYVVLLSGTMQALMLPMLGGAALYYRYRASDPRLNPNMLWDVALIISVIGVTIAGAWIARGEILKSL